MLFDENTPRRSRTIAGVQVTVPAPYAEGHTITEAEANMLNQTIAENFSNNLRKAIGEFKDGETVRVATSDEAQALVDAYAAEYEPGVRARGEGGGAVQLSPVDREVRDMATQKVKDFLKTKGLKQKDVEFAKLRDGLIEKHRDALYAAAEKVVRAREKAAGDDTDMLASIAADL